MNYAYAWKVRKIELIIVSAVCAAAGVYAGFSDGSIVEGILIWLLGTWCVCAGIATFLKTGDRVAGLALFVLKTMISGILMALSEAGSVFGALMLVWNVLKGCLGVAILAAIVAFEFVIFPITTIYYFAKSREASCAI